MTYLVERWPGLSTIPHVKLGTLPTAIEPLPKLSSVAGADVWIKRDDRSGLPYGGNKVRKLEFLLGHAVADGADTLLTTGAIGSHHVLATALHGRAQGFEVHAMMLPQAASAHAERNARAGLAAGATLHAVPRYSLLPAAMSATAARLKLARKKLYLIGPGGSDPPGVLGYVEAGLEIGHQLLAGQAAEPDAIYLPLGSGGTAVGLAIGLAAAGVMAQIVGVRVTPRHLIGRPMLHALALAVVERLRRNDDRFPRITEVAMRNLTIAEDQLGEGYAVPTSGGREATRVALETENVALDATYGAKAMAALIADARGPRRGQRVLFLHTLNSAPLDGLVENAPALPDKLARLLT